MTSSAFNSATSCALYVKTPFGWLDIARGNFAQCQAEMINARQAGLYRLQETRTGRVVAWRRINDMPA